MTDRNSGKDHFAGGLGLLAVAVYLCVKGLKTVEEQLRKRTEK